MQARIGISDTRACYVGPGLKLAPHKNSVATLALAIDGDFDLRLETHVTTETAALILPDTPHQLVTRSSMLFLYMDALSNDIPSLQKIDLKKLEFQLPRGPICPDQLLLEFGVDTKSIAPSSFTKTIRMLSRAPQNFNHIESAAELVGLSVSRFQVVFKEQMGLPFRRYRLWCKLRVVAQHLSQGRSLTQAALSSGFSSSAHLSSVFKDMFGLAPSALLKVGVEFFAPSSTTCAD